MLLELARARADAAGRTILDRAGSRGLTDHDVDQIREVIVDSGALAEVEAQIEKDWWDAMSALRLAPIN